MPEVEVTFLTSTVPSTEKLNNEKASTKKFCQSCSSRIRLFQINEEEAFLMCENTNCTFFAAHDWSTLIMKRPMRALSRSSCKRRPSALNVSPVPASTDRQVFGDSECMEPSLVLPEFRTAAAEVLPKSQPHRSLPNSLALTPPAFFAFPLATTAFSAFTATTPAVSKGSGRSPATAQPQQLINSNQNSSALIGNPEPAKPAPDLQIEGTLARSEPEVSKIHVSTSSSQSVTASECDQSSSCPPAESSCVSNRTRSSSMTVRNVTPGIDDCKVRKALVPFAPFINANTHFSSFETSKLENRIQKRIHEPVRNVYHPIPEDRRLVLKPDYNVTQRKRPPQSLESSSLSSGGSSCNSRSITPVAQAINGKKMRKIVVPREAWDKIKIGTLKLEVKKSAGSGTDIILRMVKSAHDQSNIIKPGAKITSNTHHTMLKPTLSSNQNSNGHIVGNSSTAAANRQNPMNSKVNYITSSATVLDANAIRRIMSSSGVPGVRRITGSSNLTKELLGTRNPGPAVISSSDGVAAQAHTSGQRANNLPDGQRGSNLLDGQQSSNLLDGQQSSNLPDGQQSSNLPDGQQASNFLDGQQSSNLPGGQQACNFDEGNSGNYWSSEPMADWNNLGVVSDGMNTTGSGNDQYWGLCPIVTAQIQGSSLDMGANNANNQLEAGPVEACQFPALDAGQDETSSAAAGSVARSWLTPGLGAALDISNGDPADLSIFNEPDLDCGPPVTQPTSSGSIPGLVNICDTRISDFQSMTARNASLGCANEGGMLEIRPVGNLQDLLSQKSSLMRPPVSPDRCSDQSSQVESIKFPLSPDRCSDQSSHIEAINFQLQSDSIRCHIAAINSHIQAINKAVGRTDACIPLDFNQLCHKLGAMESGTAHGPDNTGGQSVSDGQASDHDSLDSLPSATLLSATCSFFQQENISVQT